jgi:uncharacterized membrane protein YozB (DUF420 family)
MSVEQMPALNATLNGLATVFLLFGYFFIKRENREAHKKCMIAAFVTSAVFLSCYLWYHYHSPGHTVLRHPTAWINWLYYIILISHIILAVTIVPMILFTLNHARLERFDKHKRIAKITWPLWMYVSVTGVVVYLFLYVFFAEHTEKKMKKSGTAQIEESQTGQ